MSRVNTLQSGDIVCVVLVYEHADDGGHRVFVAGAYARREFAQTQAEVLMAESKTATIIDTFLDAEASRSWTGFKIDA